MGQAFTYLRWVVALLASAFGAASCMHDSLADCPPATSATIPTLKISLELDASDLGAAASADLKSAVVYIFDETTGALVSTLDLNAPKTGNTYDTNLTLDAGPYRIVTWFNPEAPFALTPPSATTAFAQARMAYTLPADGKVTSDVPWMLYGTASGITPAMLKANNGVIPLKIYDNNYVIDLSVKGLVPNGNTYRFTLVDDNHTYDYDNNIVTTGVPITYERTSTFPATRADVSILNFSIRTLRLMDNRNVQMTLVNDTTGEQFYPSNGQTPNLIQLIKQTIPNPDFDKVHTYQIDLDYTGRNAANESSFLPTVTINGWVLKRENQEITRN